MSTARIPNQRNQYQELDTRLARYVRLVQSIYDTLCNKAASAYSLCSHEGGEGVPFSFSDYPETRDAVNKMLRQMVADIHATIYSGITEEWRQSNTAQDLIADKVLKSYTGEVNRQKYTRYYQANSDELNAFKQRTISGMSLSDNLWEQATDCRAELEAAISCAIERGTSAVTLSKQLSQYLKDYKTLKADYKDTFGQAVDIKDCEYRSARLARSEINMAYRTAEQTRWRQFDFVVGYTIKTRDNGKHVGDVCDDLAGDYPKDFKWTGWHPNCMCYEIPILKTDEEFMEYDPENQQKSEREVDNVPDNFVEWVKGNAERINNAKSVPYFIADNRSTVDGIINGTQQMAIAERAKLRHDARTQVEVDDIQYRWNEKRIYDLNQATFDGLLPDECVDAIRELEDLNYSGEYDEFKSRASLLSAAVKRHNERTLDQVEAIKNQWGEHQRKHNQIKKTAGNVLKVAKDYGEVDFSELQSVIDAGNITKMQSITKSVAKSVSAMKKQEAALADIIPDVHTWHKQFTISDLQTVHTAVEKKLASWSSLTLEQQTMKLTYEFVWVEKTKKYSTWEVAQSAYLVKLRDTSEKWMLDLIKAGDISGASKASEYYSRAVLTFSNNNYAKQKSILSATREKQAESNVKKYLKETPTNPHYVWGGDIGGVWSANAMERMKLAAELNGVTAEELSLVTRFTSGMTFYNAYNLRHTSAYWKSVWDSKMSSLSRLEQDAMERIIEEYTLSLDGITNKMKRYEGIVYRGVHSDGGGELLAQFQSAWKSKSKTWVNTAAASSSTDIGVSYYTFDNRGYNDLIMVIKNKTGAYIRPISEYDYEKEVLLIKDTKYRLLKEPYKIDGHWFVELEEI